MTRPLLQLQHLQKTVGQRLLLDIDQLRIEPGCAYVLTGANGSGKSTLLRVLAGLAPAEIARASFGGDAVRLSPYPRTMRDAIVYVHQHPVLFSTSLFHNIAYGLLARGIEKAEIARRVEEAIAWAGVAHLRGSRPAVLSGGEKQRVALARAKVLAPRLLLLDEPTANLDGRAKEQVIALIPSLLEAGNSVVIACHDRDLIAVPGMQRMKLRDGHLQTRAVPAHS
ncbi:MAG TPA: energy-coupling factor ABC transporter ATP-binding protein [Noviherbaspirillum sp.]|nr:energy-coupling factor ABC transporter ATP-binding protein [Noviherbaspirillum sp.]HJV83851.1 energy-coupling factor ABC transporter ATP-binding protein [Noviherbaspirillum sp.]